MLKLTRTFHWRLHFTLTFLVSIFRLPQSETISTIPTVPQQAKQPMHTFTTVGISITNLASTRMIPFLKIPMPALKRLRFPGRFIQFVNGLLSVPQQVQHQDRVDYHHTIRIHKFHSLHHKHSKIQPRNCICSSQKILPLETINKPYMVASTISLDPSTTPETPSPAISL